MVKMIMLTIEVTNESQRAVQSKRHTTPWINQVRYALSHTGLQDSVITDQLVQKVVTCN